MLAQVNQISSNVNIDQMKEKFNLFQREQQQIIKNFPQFEEEKIPNQEGDKQ